MVEGLKTDSTDGGIYFIPISNEMRIVSPIIDSRARFFFEFVNYHGIFDRVEISEEEFKRLKQFFHFLHYYTTATSEVAYKEFLDENS